MADAGLVSRVKHVNSQGVVVFGKGEIRNYRDYLAHVDEGFHENYMLSPLCDVVLMEEKEVDSLSNW